MSASPSSQEQPTPCLVCDDDQASRVLHEYRSLRLWYENLHAESDLPEDIGHWEVSYQQYKDDFVAEVADEMQLRPGDAVFESAVGSGWLLKSLRELQPPEVADTLRLAGCDIIPSALDIAKRGLLDSTTAPSPVLCLGDSANLSAWIPPAVSLLLRPFNCIACFAYFAYFAFARENLTGPHLALDAPPVPLFAFISMPQTFDAVICGYLEGKAVNAGGDEWAGNWVAQMAYTCKPGGLLFIGNNHMPPAHEGEGGADPDANLTPPPSWWTEAAESDRFGWGVDPASCRIMPLRSAALRELWGERYSVFMQRDATSPPRVPRPLGSQGSYWRDREWDAVVQRPRLSARQRRARLSRFSKLLEKLLSANGGEMLVIREEATEEEEGEEEEGDGT